MQETHNETHNGSHVDMDSYQCICDAQLFPSGMFCAVGVPTLNAA